MQLIIDTGSSWTWLVGDDCPTWQCTGVEFESGKSDTFKATRKKYDITYGKGYVEGLISQDQMSLLSNPTKYDIISQVDFLLIYLARDLASLKADGLLGLAPNAPSDHPYETLVTDMHRQKMIEKNLFSLYLGRTDEQSKIWIGGYDSSYVRDALEGLHSREDLDAMTEDELAGLI